MNRNSRIVIGFILSFIFISCKSEKKDDSPKASGGRAGSGNRPIQAEAFIVRSKALSENLEIPGTLLPFEVTEIRPEISGRVVALNIPEGSFVQKGALLIKLFDGDLQAQLKKLQVQLQIAQKTAERQKELLTINGISQQEYDLSELQVSNLKADIDLIHVNISKTEIRAPFTGRIGLRNISTGAYISPTTLVTTISQVSQLKLEFTVPEKYSETMHKGRKVSFTIAGTDQKFNAAVLATESNIEATTRTLKIRAVVQGIHQLLVPGAFAKVALQLGKNDHSLIVPSQAVIPQARNKSVIVYKDGKPNFQVVSTGIRDSSYVQVLDGVKEGDTVITTGLLAIRPESKIKLVKVQ
ncbi:MULTISPECIES: efflux RND transporter periplasmic adaptor subunit [Niastella]|uniref:Efflux RND transporter periplasmic adaptor subunit n=1 Tax=Niastella soli TaxID=2821487 RepID=A0ABS3Z5A6_9BACT|nr:efflux RND transporter periplasmic adaptor subunit [Niastella soli]MBO9205358.1 efflux RND transporter periplasmic adaptor subunit [Niastella soli]